MTTPDDTNDQERAASMGDARIKYDFKRAAAALALAYRDNFQVDCPHTDLECGYCISCGKDCTDDIVSRAEAAADAREDR